MTIAYNQPRTAGLLSVADKSFTSTCLGHALESLLSRSKENRVQTVDLDCIRDGLASLSLCLADLHKDKFYHLHTEVDESEALTLLYSVAKLVQWIEYSDREIWER